VELKDLVSISISVAALAVSITVAGRTRHYNRAAMRSVSRNNYMNALLNLNREIMSHPELWAVYDPHWRPDKYDTVEEKARRRAFIGYHLNLFELFYADYHQQRRDTTDSDAHEHWNAWDRYVRWFLSASGEAREIVNDQDAMALLHREFREYLVAVCQRAVISS
jgi:hypothetical protein